MFMVGLVMTDAEKDISFGSYWTRTRLMRKFHFLTFAVLNS
jgi:hypothetical protein